jgi:hypothetical protein
MYYNIFYTSIVLIYDTTSLLISTKYFSARLKFTVYRLFTKMKQKPLGII